MYNRDEINFKDHLSKVGIDLDNEKRSATMIIHNEQTVLLEKNDSSSENYEYLPIGQALSMYPWLKDYSFVAVPANYDEVTLECSKQKRPIGFFIRVKKGVKVSLPCQAAMFILSDLLKQTIHNIVILEEDSELELITGCTSDKFDHERTHIAVEEYYVGKHAKLKSTMIHSWGSHMKVFPRSAAIVSENGYYENNYISIEPAKIIHSNPMTYLNGENASAKYLTVVLGTPGSTINTEGNIYLNAKNTSAELLHRGVCTGGTLHQGGLLIANAPCRAHIDCAGMILNQTKTGLIQSIPGLESHHEDAHMSHEASIGKISPESVEYLMTRGMDEMQAISMIVRGFISNDIEGLGDDLNRQISEIAEIAGHGEE